MTILLYVYLAGMLVVGTRLGWHFVIRFDRYDWHYNRMGIWVSLTLGVLVWPMLLLKLKSLLNPSAMFPDELGIVARARERDTLRRAPPPCGEVIRYRQDCSGSGEKAFGEFLFPAVAVERVLKTKLRTSPKLTHNDEGGILNWVLQRDPAHSAPTDVPALWSRFQYVANDLIRAGEGRVRCGECQEVYATGTLIPQDAGVAGWIFEELECPRGHKLLIVEVAHFLLRK